MHADGLSEEDGMSEKTKITISRIITRILDMFADIEKEKAHWYKKHGVDVNKLRHISSGINSCLQYSPAEQRLKSFLMSLEEEQVRKVLTLYFAGRDHDKDIYGQFQYSKNHFPTKEDIVYRLLDTQILKESLLLGRQYIDEQNINLEDNFDKIDQQ